MSRIELVGRPGGGGGSYPEVTRLEDGGDDGLGNCLVLHVKLKLTTAGYGVPASPQFQVPAIGTLLITHNVHSQV